MAYLACGIGLVLIVLGNIPARAQQQDALPIKWTKV